jgi:anti-repressor protein
VVIRGDEPWFVAKDVCAVLGIEQATRAVEPLDDDEKGVSSIHTLGGEQQALIVSEGGLYRLILRSRQAT